MSAGDVILFIYLSLVVIKTALVWSDLPSVVRRISYDEFLIQAGTFLLLAIVLLGVVAFTCPVLLYNERWRFFLRYSYTEIQEQLK